MNKYGFVYLWRDKKRKKYYVGCHWGTEDDGYICSSKWMRDTYRYRPEDFKRRIISRIYTNRKDLFLEEYRFLEMIPEHRLGSRYYNLSKVHPNHWSTCPNQLKTISEKNSKTMKAKHQDPEYKKIYMEGRKKSVETYKETIQRDPEVLQRRARTMKGTMAEKFPVEHRKHPFARRDPNTGEFTEVYLLKLREGVSNYWDNLSDEEREEVREQRSLQAKQRKGFYRSNSRTGLKNSEEHNRAIQEANGHKVIIDEVEYISMSEAGRVHGVTQATVKNRCVSSKWPTWVLKQ